MKPLLEFFPIVLFFVVYKLYDIYMATEVLMAATILQVVFYWLLFRKVESMHRVTLVLVFMMGGLTLYLHDEQFIKWKLSIIEWLFGGALLVSQFVGNKTFIERMFGSVMELPSRIWRRFNFNASLFFFGVGFLNVYVMFNYSTDDWVTFKTFGVPGLMLIFMAVQMVFLYKHLPSVETEK